MKKIFALMVAVAFGFGSIGCDDKPKATEKTTKTTEVKDGKTTTETKTEKKTEEVKPVEKKEEVKPVEKKEEKK